MMTNRRLILIWIVASHLMRFLLCEETEYSDEVNSTQLINEFSQNSSKAMLLSPRMDYEQWKPLGRGDPLKNDPTYDYVPPVLDRVHYWIEPTLRKPDQPIPAEKRKTEILILGGISIKKNNSRSQIPPESKREGYDSFMKFVEGPKFTSQQKISRPTLTIPLTYFPSHFYSGKPEHGTFVSGKGKQKVPSTVLVPPPMPTKESTVTIDFHKTNSLKYVPSVTTLQATTPSSPNTTPLVTIQEANLVYQASNLEDENKWNGNKNQLNFIADGSSQVTWKTSTISTPVFTLPKQIFVQHDNKIAEENKNNPSIQPPESFIQIEFSTVPRNETSNLNKTTDMLKPILNFVTPYETTEGIKIKNQIEIDNTVSASNHKNSLFNRNRLKIMGVDDYVRPSITSTKDILETMQTMQPPPVTDGKPLTTLQTLLQKLPSVPSPYLLQTIANPSGDLYVSSETKLTPSVASTTSMPETMTTMSMTTDPLFKHYKQPAEPIRGPMYLIIQGHSKVKNFGPSKEIHGIPIQENNEVITSEDDDKYAVRHLHSEPEKKSVDDLPRQGRSSILQTLSHVVQTGLGAIDFPAIGAERRKDDDVQETELAVGYDVDATEN